MKILLKHVPGWLAKWTAFVWFLFSLFFLILVMSGYQAQISLWMDAHPGLSVVCIFAFSFVAGYPMMRSGLPFIDPPRRYSGHPIDMSDTIALCKQITEKLKNENQGPGTKFPPVPRD